MLRFGYCSLNPVEVEQLFRSTCRMNALNEGWFGWAQVDLKTVPLQDLRYWGD